MSSGGDDTDLNAIELSCRVPGFVYEVDTVVSHSGLWGDWTAYELCPVDYFLVAFSLRVEPYVGTGEEG